MTDRKFILSHLLSTTLVQAQTLAFSTLSATATVFSSAFSKAILPAASSSLFQASSSRTSSSSFSVALSGNPTSPSSPSSTKAVSSPTISSGTFKFNDNLAYNISLAWVMGVLLGLH